MTTRRDFLRQTALLGAGLSISPFFIQAGNTSVSANDKIGVGLIGCNGMGFEDLKAFLRNPEVECVAIADIDESHRPTPDMIDDMLAQVRSKPGTTFIFTSPRGKIHGINPFKAERVRLASGDTDAGALLESWAGISIVESHNIAEKQPHIKVK